MKQNDCLIRKLILLTLCVLCCMNEVYSQRKGMFLNKKLEGIASQLLGAYHLDCSLPKSYPAPTGLCPGKQLIITTNQFGVVNHIGLKLFSREMMQQNPSPVYTFVERYLLELLLLKDDARINQYLSESRVTFRSFPLGNKRRDINLLSALAKIQPDQSIIVTTDNSWYTVSWYQNKQQFLSIRFPIQYELIWGMNKVESENLFYTDLQIFQLHKTTFPTATPGFLTPMNDSCYLAAGDFYGIESITSNQYYKKQAGGKYLPLLDAAYPLESLFNLFTVEANEKMKARVTQRMYGGKKNTMELSLNELVSFCKVSGCEAYVGIERRDANQVRGIALMVNRSLGYNHLFYFDVDLRILTSPEKYVMNIQLYGFVPIHNVNNLFNDQTK